MKRRKNRRILTALSLFAFVWVASGGASQLVYCVGADGHAGIEHSHDAAPCNSPLESPGPGDTATTMTDAGQDTCTDLPLLSQASKQRDDDPGSILLSGAFATPVAVQPGVRPVARVQASALARTVLFSPQDLSARRTTVLQV